MTVAFDSFTIIMTHWIMTHWAVLCLCGCRVKKDMDEVGGKLMGAHGYCTQVRIPSVYTLG